MPVPQRPFRSAKNADRRGELAWWLILAMLVIFALAGGASREDSLAQAVVRGLVPAVFALLVTLCRPVEWRSLTVPLVLAGAAVGLVALMLVPLPPSLWTAMPGHAPLEAAAELTGTAQPWRPWAMTPPLAKNALFALVPPALLLLSLIYLAPDRRRNLLPLMAAGVIASAVLGVLQIGMGSDSPLRWYAVTNRDAGVGFFANRNHQAVFLAFGFPLLAYWAAARGDRDNGVLARVGLAAIVASLLAVAIVTTGSRAGLLIGGLAILGAGLIHAAALTAAVRQISRKSRALWAFAVAGVLAVMVAAIAFSPQAQSVVRLFGLDPADDLRARALPTILRMARDFFPFGTGFGGFEPAYRAAEPFDLLSLQYLNEAHNDFLQVVIEGGVFGAALLGALVVWWLLRSFRLVRERGGDRATTAARTGALLVGLMGLASLFDYPVRTPLMMATLMLAIGWMASPQPAPAGPLRSS